jgi:hypothetical protein
MRYVLKTAGWWLVVALYAAADRIERSRSRSAGGSATSAGSGS